MCMFLSSFYTMMDKKVERLALYGCPYNQVAEHPIGPFILLIENVNKGWATINLCKWFC